MERERNLKIVKNEKDNLLQEAIREAILETRSSDKMTDVIENLCFLIEEDETYHDLDISGISDYELSEKIKKEFKTLRTEIPRHVSSFVGNCYSFMNSEGTIMIFKVLDFDNIDFMYKCEAFEVGREGEGAFFTYYEELTIGTRLLLSCMPMFQCDYCAFHKKAMSFLDKLNVEKSEKKKGDILFEVMKFFLETMETTSIRRVVKNAFEYEDDPEEEVKNFLAEYQTGDDFRFSKQHDKIVKKIIQEESYLYNNFNPKYV